VIVVVDSPPGSPSAEQTSALARRFGAMVHANPDGPCGPAISRNRGASLAGGDVLVFIDSDVAVHMDTLSRLERVFLDHPEISAVFGSYDDAPADKGIVSQYKNLQHHYVHQNGRQEASTFWAGCGAVRREVFLKVGGFDERYRRPSIEDIELGLRLHQAGYRIWLCPEIQATHLKRWSLGRLLRADIFDRAVPWSQLIFFTSYLPKDLNLDARSRWSVAAVWAAVFLLALGFWIDRAWVGAILCAAGLFCAAAVIALNQDFYRFVHRRSGWQAALASIGLHSLYYAYSSLTFIVVMAWHALRARFRRARPAPSST
jgi:GT2 family glycosyltransferase